MSYIKLNRKNMRFKFLRGLSTNHDTNVDNLGEEGEPMYYTDTKELLIHDGTSYEKLSHPSGVNISDLNIIGYTSSATTPSTTEFPTDKDFGIHKDTVTGNVYVAYNDGGVIKSVTLT